MYTYMQIFTHTHTYIYMHTCAYAHMHMHIQIHMYSRMDRLHEIVFEEIVNKRGSNIFRTPLSLGVG